MKKFLYILLIAILLLSGCSRNSSEEVWGSFTAEKTHSYDKMYYAVQTVVEKDNTDYIEVSVYLSEDDSFIDSFIPARAKDFWGICWEKDTYNIWIQSADVGIICYIYENKIWEIDENAVRPVDIISKYD